MKTLHNFRDGNGYPTFYLNPNPPETVLTEAQQGWFRLRGEKSKTRHLWFW